MEFGDLTGWIMATGAVGSAAFGVVEALKGTRVGTLGAERVRPVLGEDAWRALTLVYGESLDELVRESFRRGQEPLAELLRTGLRVALSSDDAASQLGKNVPREAHEPELAVAVRTLRDHARRALDESLEPSEEGDREPGDDQGRADESDARAVLGRFEALIDARVEAAACAAQCAYASWMQRVAILVAVIGAIGASIALEGGATPDALLSGLIVGVAAVPVAPVTKDLVALLGHASTALRGRTPG